MSRTDVANAERFERIGTTADARTAARTRDAFAHWLTAFFDLDPNRISDLVLAVNEALANSAEHAYAPPGGSGTTDVRATFDPDTSTLVVTIGDRGVWRMPTATPGNRSRGRGIPLMTALSDATAIETSHAGTVVSLSWLDIHQR